MPTDRESAEIKKAIAYDLIEIIEAAPEQTSYTPEEIKKMIKTYISATISATTQK